MNNATSIVLRPAGWCLRSPPWPRPTHLLRRAFGDLAISRQSPYQTRTSVSSPSCTPSQRCWARQFSCSHVARFNRSPVVFKLTAYDASKEKGLSFRDNDLKSQELVEVFGEVIPPPRQANRLLKVLHGRRLDGTLDLELDAELQNLMKRYPYAYESALYWLREQYPIDEDEAILQRIEREEASREQDNPSELTERAQELGVYGRQQSEQQGPEYYGPQSGRYHAALSEKEGDVFGRSELDRIKAENEAAAKEEERKLEERIDQIRAQEEVKSKEKSQAIATRPEQGIEKSTDEFQEPNKLQKWVMRGKMRATSDLTLESPEIQNLTTAQRLLPSFLFVLLGCVGCYLFSQYWYPPKQSDRLWPDASLSFATVGGLIAINTAIFVLWRWPPALRLLNRQFIVVPAYPRVWSMLGNIFSHFYTRHFVFNMLGLVIFGPALHEDVGRGTFLAIYLASGLVGSFASLSHHVLRGLFHASSQGASGSIWGIAAAYFTIHGDRDFEFIFVPKEWREQLQVKGWVMLAFLIATDVFVGMGRKNIDTWAHWMGMAVGILLGGSWKHNRDKESGNGRFEPAPKNLRIMQERETSHEEQATGSNP